MRLVLLFLVTVTLGSRAAHATTDTKTFPGLACVKSSGSGTASISSGSMYNSSATSTVMVTCPITRDWFSDIGLTSGTEVWVSDQSTSVAVTCILYARDMTNGDLLDYEIHSSSGTGVQVLEFAGPLSGDDDAYYYMECLVPAKDSGYSYVKGYSTVESADGSK
jgi:hypothetical protein